MAWVKLTRKTGTEIYVNMDRFDRVERVTNEDGDEVTQILSVLSEDEGDYATVEVVDAPDSFMTMLMAHGKMTSPP